MPTAVFQRWLGQDLDLSTWFTRPCVIVMGVVSGASCPVPVRIDGEPADVDKGKTIVRWVYPLSLTEQETVPSAPIPIEPEEG